MYCKFCNSVIPDEAVFCPNCGTPVDDMLEETGVLSENDSSSDYSDKYSNIQLTPNANNGENAENINDKNPIPADVPDAYVNPQYQNSQPHNQSVQMQYQSAQYQNGQYYTPPNTNSNDYSYNNAKQQEGWQQNMPTENRVNSNVNIERPNIINCYKKFWKNYLNFTDRSRRSEYWYVVLSNVIISIIISPLCAIPYIGTFFIGLVSLYSLATFIPSLALVIRRLHDIGKDWYYIFFILIPIAGAIILLVWYCQDSQPGTNKFGANPKGINY